MNTLHLARCLGDIATPSFQRYWFRRQLESLDQDLSVCFNRRALSTEDDGGPSGPVVAHKAGTNCIAIDQTVGRYLISGGADTFIRLWDLETPPVDPPANRHTPTYHPLASISRGTKGSHTHSITSLSIYPHDPTPQTLLTTSYDQSLLLTCITPTSLEPLHSFPLDFTVYTHAVSPHPSQALVAVGTSHPAPRLIDLRTALATHTLPGLNGAIYSLAWHPRREHILVSSSTDGRILAFDIRRATPAFASFSLDDSLGVTDPANHARAHLDYSHRAHEAPITGILFTPAGDKLISAAQDQRIRIWDVASGKSDLVHFGPRIRNSRDGELKPALAPPGTAGGTGLKPGHDLLFWPNDDARGEILVHELREGTLVKTLKTKSVAQTVTAAASVTTARGIRARASYTGTGRNTTTHNPLHGPKINALSFRPAPAVQLFSAHVDGRICTWLPASPADADSDSDGDGGSDTEDQHGDTDAVEAAASRKRKRALIDGLVEGLTGRRVTFL